MTILERGVGIPAGMSTREFIRQRILGRLTQDGATDTATQQPDQVRAAIRMEIDRYCNEANAGLLPVYAGPDELRRQLERSFLEAGPLTKYFNHDVAATDVTVEGSVTSFIGPDGILHTDTESISEDEMMAITTRLLADAGGGVDASQQVVTKMIWNNSVRATVAIPNVSRCLDATFRVYREQVAKLKQLVEWGSLPLVAANFLAALMWTRVGLVFSGAPGAGKTTLLAAMIREIPPSNNIRIVQEARELSVPDHAGGDWIPSSDETIRSLLRFALTCGPNWLILAESKGEEAVELLRASNAGCGFSTTVHADSATLAMGALVDLAILAGNNLEKPAVARRFSTLVDVSIHCQAEPLHLVAMGREMRRRVMEIAAVPSHLSVNDEFVLEPIFVRERLGAAMEFQGVGALGELAETIDRCMPEGITAHGLCEGAVSLL
jgi:pilus assembly protein CpaF